MSGVTLDLGGSELGKESLDVPVPAQQPRYHGLDGVRATAILLGVFYHLPIAFMAADFGAGFGFGFGGSPKMPVDNWLHSFRMPLFFLISGFFANMMLGKYGLRRYLARRWWRIGAPLLVAFFALAGVRMAIEYFRANPVPGFGPPNAGAAGFGPAANPFALPGQATPGGGAPMDPTGAGPFGGPGGAFGNTGPAPAGDEGTPSPAPQGGQGEPFGAPGAGAFGFPGMAPFGGPQGGMNAPGNALQQPGGPAAFPPMPDLQLPSRSWADALFGENSRHFNLEHLWFLWYLLIFVTVGPFVAQAISLLFRSSSLHLVDRFGRGLIRSNLLPLLLGLVTLPALLHARGFMGWSLANPIGFSAPFPDFLFQYYADEPYYFLCFLAGWWFFRLRDSLPDLAHRWLWNLVLGVVGFAASQRLAAAYAFRLDAPGYDWIRVGGFALYGVGAAYTVFGFMGFFQRYLDRATRLGRYIADTSLWIYLVHLPLIPYLMWWVQPARSSWWGATLAGMAVVTGVALVLFELLIRPTPLVHIFGPASPKRTAAQQSA